MVKFDLDDYYSENGESEFDWLKQKEAIKEIVTDEIQEFERSIRVLIEKRLAEESGAITQSYTKIVSDLSTQASENLKELDARISTEVSSFKEKISESFEKSNRDMTEHQQIMKGNHYT